MGGYRPGGGSGDFSDADQTNLDGNTAARHTRAHDVDSASDHTVGSVAANCFAINDAGAWASSSGRTAKAGIINGTTFVLGGANTYIYGNLAYGGVPAGGANGGLIFNNLDGPLKLMCSARADAAGNKSVVIGTGISGTGPALDILSIGWWDTTGPTWYDVYEFTATGEIQTGTINSEYMVDGGKLTWDSGNNRLQTGFKDPNDSTIHANWTEVPGDASGTFAKATGVTTITVPSGTTSEFVNGEYDATRLEFSMPSYSDWDVFVHRTCEETTNAGSHFGVYFGAYNSGEFINFQALWNGSAHQELIYRGTATIVYNNTTGAAATWQRLANHGGTLICSHYNAAIGSPPSESDWTELGRYTPATWSTHDVTLFIGGLSLGGGSAPGATPDFGQVTIKYL